MSEILSDEARHLLLEPLFKTGWALAEGRDALVKTYEFENFVEAFGWMTRAAMWAEKWDHHPDWHNVYKTVKVELWSHDLGGLSARDAKLARKMDSLL
ncbi:4a-hydroxytetrahydrobiopterin dehydratase [Pseudodonghicola sp.]|uniref:4a-hydroxytetrahydrobiopterin dehydratase n=1 Tax=Pseudodonghicola sp. TaxID=1969463 RepID=UPI003A96F752